MISQKLDGQKMLSCNPKGGSEVQKHASCRVRITTPQEGRYVSLMVKRNRNVTRSPTRLVSHEELIMTICYCIERGKLVL